MQGLTRARVRIGQAGALAACVLALVACGSKQKVDSGGFTTDQRKAAVAALAQLRQTAIPRTVVAISYRSGQAPNTCAVIPAPGASGTFDLVLAWQQLKPDYRSVPQSLLEARIGGASAKTVRFHVTSFGGKIPESTRVKASLVRAAVARPAEQCEVLESGQLELIAPH
jgi:hypothetical protein